MVEMLSKLVKMWQTDSDFREVVVVLTLLLLGGILIVVGG